MHAGPNEAKERVYVKIMVFAPHPDDDVLGCGGSIINHTRAGDLIKIVYMTDGRYSFLSFGIKDPSPEKLVEIRKKEAKAASKELGVSDADLIFLNYADQSLARNMRSASKKVRKILSEIKPDLVYIPHKYEKHPDHVATNKILRQTLYREFEVYQYEVWTPLNKPNMIVDISDVLHIKKRAAYKHQSQVKVIKDLFQKILNSCNERFQTFRQENCFERVRRAVSRHVISRV